MRPDTRPTYPPEFDEPDPDEPETWRARMAGALRARHVYLYGRRASLLIDWRYWTLTITAGSTQDDPDLPRWYAGIHTGRSILGRRWSAWLGRRRWTYHHHSRRRPRA